MRREVLAALIVAAMLADGTPAEAQPKLKMFPPFFRMQRLPKMMRPPRFQVAPPRLKTLAIPPSQALSIASRKVPNAKPIGVKLLNNNTYAVTLRQNNVVTRVIVDAQTGAAQ
jgi:hypothetical protein